MLARIFSCAVVGLEGVIIEVEVDYTNGLPGMTIVGLPDAAVQESRERVQTAVKNAGSRLPLSAKKAPRMTFLLRWALLSSQVFFRMTKLKTQSSSANFLLTALYVTRAEFCRWPPQPALMDSSGCSSLKWMHPKQP
jgi:hypothetical protein